MRADYEDEARDLHRQTSEHEYHPVRWGGQQEKGGNHNDPSCCQEQKS